MNRSESIGKLAEALAKAQSKIESAPKDNIAKVRGTKRDGSPIEYSYSYSTLADVWTACRGPLSENGLAVIQTVVAKGAAVTVSTTLAHASNEWIGEELTMTAVDEKPQSIGSAITYARRYALGAIVGVVSEEDDDGNVASGRDHQTERKQYAPKPNGNGHSKPPPAGPPPEEQIAIKLIESLETIGEFLSAEEKAGWQEKHRPEVNGLPAYLKKNVVDHFAKVPVKA